MSEKNIVICDQEVKYAEKLMENIMERERICGEGICMQYLGKCKDTFAG